MKAHLRKIFSGFLIALYISSLALPGAALATPQQSGVEQVPALKRDPKHGINPETGKVSFIGAGDPIFIPGVTDKDLPPEARALGIINAYSKDFGLKNASQDLQLVKSEKDASGKNIVRYQQMYKGIPIIASEMIVNMNAQGELLSITGEVSSKLMLDTKPAIKSQEALKTGLSEIAALYNIDEKSLSFSDPELSIFDESILTASTRPAELAWRMEVTAKDETHPIREMVLVNAQTGEISFHVNQVDTGNETLATDQGDRKSSAQQSVCTATPLSNATYFDMAIDEAHGRIFASDANDTKLDVFTYSDGLLPTFLMTICLGFHPRGIDISPDGNELAVALFDGGKIAFYNLSLTNDQLRTQTPQYLVPNVDSGFVNKPYELIYGRAGRLYSVGNPGSSGIDYIHAIDTSTNPKTEISRSSYAIRMSPRLAISADKNALFVLHTNQSPYKLYRFDITTDIVTYQVEDPHGPIAGSTIATLNDPTKIFTSFGQVWSTTGYGPRNVLSQMGTFSDRGNEIEYVKAHNLMAVTIDSRVSLINTDEYQVVARFTINGVAGVTRALSDGSALFVSTTSGLQRVSLMPFPSPLPIPCSSTLSTTSYYDMVIDDVHQKIFASDRNGLKVDVFSYANPNKDPIFTTSICTGGRQPLGLDISSDRNEIAVSLLDGYKLAFINTSTYQVNYVPFFHAASGYASPSDLVYGRPGRLYIGAHDSDLDPNGYIYAMDLTSKALITRSTARHYASADISRIAISADKLKLFYAQTGVSPQNMFRLDVSTDNLGNNEVSGPHGPVSVNTLLVLPDNSKLITSRGQSWAYDLQTQLGSLATSGSEIEYIPMHNAVAITNNNPQVSFFSANTYASLGNYSVTGTAGVTRSLSDGSILYISTGNGLQKLALTSFPLPTATPSPSLTPSPTRTPTIGPSPTTPVTPGPGPSPTLRPSSTAGPSPTSAPPSATGNRRTYSAGGGGSLPGTFLCDQSQPGCTNSADLDADAAHRYAADTFVFYNTHHQRNSIDNAGGVITSTVNYGINYQNAFWNGSQVVYGDNMTADDVVAHEITHGVTEKTSNLIYYGQSGAINESFSDAWGEFIDQTNGSGNDTLSVKWLIGEDTSLGVIRSMSNPPAYGHPDKMSSPFFYTGSGDNGGVHINSGVNNKAAYLLVVGGTFNGKTITGIGMDKTAAVYYETQVHHLTMGANYNDLYYALLQACQNLIGGADGITQNDCEQVRLAAEAVEMVPFTPPTPSPTASKTPTFTPTSTPPYSYNPLYLSLTGTQTIGGVASADEDILRFDGTNWSLYFDGSDVGVASPDLSAFAIVNANTVLMSFGANVTVNGVTATPQDVLRFDATNLGSATIGTFSMYFDGSDVGFADTTNEKIDSLKLLPDGRLLISATGNPSVTGATIARDEDVLAFAPTTLGDTTSGTWSMYFDGSDVGLSETSGEDIDALDVVGNNIYLSAQDIFSVNGIAGEDDDIFICTATSIGDVTACNYSSSLYFDGSTWGLTANDIDGINFLASVSIPTAVPTNIGTSTPTRTPTRTPTATSSISPSPTHTSTATLTPSRTPTSGPGNTLTFAPYGDARVVQTSPGTNYGTATTLLTDGDSGAAQTSFISFNVSGLSGPIQSAKLRVFCSTNGTANGPAVYRAHANWAEYGVGGVTWNTQPPLLSGAFDNKGAIAANSWVEYDVTALITTNGTYSFALVADSSDGIEFSSREGTMPPQLVVTLGSGSSTSTPAPTNLPSTTNTPTATRTPTAVSATPLFTATGTQVISSPTSTATTSGVPSQTATIGSNLFTFTPTGDAYVDANNPANNYGALTTLRVDASPIIRSYLRFDVQGLNGTVTRATLRVFANSASSQGCMANAVSDISWSESTLNYNNAPLLGSALGSSGPIAAGAWISVDVTAHITGNGTFNLALTTPGSTAVSLASRESGANAPQLIIETAP